VLIIRPAHNSGLAKAAIEICANIKVLVRQPSPSRKTLDLKCANMRTVQKLTVKTTIHQQRILTNNVNRNIIKNAVF
jgi:hypothetical protein